MIGRRDRSSPLFTIGISVQSAQKVRAFEVEVRDRGTRTVVLSLFTIGISVQNEKSSQSVVANGRRDRSSRLVNRYHDDDTVR